MGEGGDLWGKMRSFMQQSIIINQKTSKGWWKKIIYTRLSLWDGTQRQCIYVLDRNESCFYKALNLMKVFWKYQNEGFERWKIEIEEKIGQNFYKNAGKIIRNDEWYAQRMKLKSF